MPLLSPEWFYSEVNQEVARSISNVFQKGIAVDYLSVAADIRARVPAVSTGTTGNIDSLLVGMADAVPTVANLGFYQAQVKESWRRRKIILACTDTVTSAYKTDEDIASVEEKFQPWP